jgi:hypothetical protein
VDFLLNLVESVFGKNKKGSIPFKQSGCEYKIVWFNF